MPPLRGSAGSWAGGFPGFHPGLFSCSPSRESGDLGFVLSHPSKSWMGHPFSCGLGVREQQILRSAYPTKCCNILRGPERAPLRMTHLRERWLVSGA